MKVLKTAVIGLGRIGWQYHVPQLMKHSGFELVAVADPMKERLDEAKEQCSLRGYEDYRELLEKEELDLIVIASPTPFHLEQAVTAMEKGIDVFVEKPMAQSLEEADKMIEASKRTGRKLMVYQPHRIAPDVQVLKSILARDLIGRVYMIQGSFTSEYMRRNDWQALKKYGGGMLNNYGSHFVDALLYITGSTAKKISCSLRCIASLGDADDVVKALIETENGIILDIDINRAAAVQIPRWLVFGSRGAIRHEYTDKGAQFYVRYFKEEELPKMELVEDMAAPGRKYDNTGAIPWREEIVPISWEKRINFYDKCYEFYALDSEPFVPLEHSREVMRVLEECRKDAGW